MNGDGDRIAQKVAGAFAGVVGVAVLFVPIFALERMPSGVWLYGGLACIAAGLWLWSPVGMGGLLGQARGAIPFLHDHGDDDA